MSDSTEQKTADAPALVHYKFKRKFGTYGCKTGRWHQIVKDQVVPAEDGEFAHVAPAYYDIVDAETTEAPPPAETATSQPPAETATDQPPAQQKPKAAAKSKTTK